MIFLPDAMLKTCFIGALIVWTSQPAAALEPRLATCTADDPAMPVAMIADDAQPEVASKKSTSESPLTQAPGLPASSMVYPAPPVLGAPLSDERLGSLRGGTDTAIGGAALGGVVTGNAATNVLTGSNFIDAGSFANANGIPMVIQNTGANVLIQNATVINLQLK